jgi:hypothetical protein
MYLTYIIKTWLATMVAAPIVLFALILFIDPDMLALYPIVQLLIFVIFIGFTYSIPTLLFVGVISNIFRSIIEKTNTFRSVAIILSVIGVIATFLFLSGEAFGESKEYTWALIFAFLYCLFIVVFGLFFKVKMKQEDAG